MVAMAQVRAVEMFCLEITKGASDEAPYGEVTPEAKAIFSFVTEGIAKLLQEAADHARAQLQHPAPRPEDAVAAPQPGVERHLSVVPNPLRPRVILRPTDA